MAARDEMKAFVQSTLPRSRKGVRPPRFDPETRKLVSSKLESMVSKSYLLEVGHVKTLLHYFAVPKGDSDMHLRGIRWHLMRFERLTLESEFLFAHLEKRRRNVIVQLLDGQCRFRRVFSQFIRR